jgi:hypothetical protein
LHRDEPARQLTILSGGTLDGGKFGRCGNRIAIFNHALDVKRQRFGAHRQAFLQGRARRNAAGEIVK